MTVSDMNGSICRRVLVPGNVELRFAHTYIYRHPLALLARERVGGCARARALAMGHQLLVTDSAYAIERRRDCEWALNGPDVAAAFSGPK